MVTLVNDSEYSKSTGAKPISARGCIYLVSPGALLLRFRRIGCNHRVWKLYAVESGVRPLTTRSGFSTLFSSALFRSLIEYFPTIFLSFFNHFSTIFRNFGAHPIKVPSTPALAHAPSAHQAHRAPTHTSALFTFLLGVQFCPQHWLLCHLGLY